MGFLSSIWDGLKGLLESILTTYAGLFEPSLGQAAWGVAIILLTVTIRILLIPLMVRQTRSMRAMQALQPEMKKIQEKYKADRSMMKTDPERYRKIKEKQREAQMALYQEHGANPVGGCLPLLLQMPVFLALFQILQNGNLTEEIGGASFLGIPSLNDNAQALIVGGVSAGAVAAITLILLQVGTTYFTQKQMMARNTTVGAEQLQAQKIMLYVMPGFLGFLSFTFPIGVVLYWVTTNVWTIGQQAFIFRKMDAEEARAAESIDRGTTAKGTVAQAKAVADAAEHATSADDPAARDGKGRGKGGPAGGKGTPKGKATSKGDGTPKGNGAATGGTKPVSNSAASRAARRAQTAANRPTGSGQRRQRGSGRPQAGGPTKGAR